MVQEKEALCAQFTDPNRCFVRRFFGPVLRSGRNELGSHFVSNLQKGVVPIAGDHHALRKPERQFDLEGIRVLPSWDSVFSKLFQNKRCLNYDLS